MKVKNQIANYLIAIVSLFLISCEDRTEPSLYDLQVYAETLGKDDIEDEEIMIPFDLQKDLATIHFVAGFDRFGK